MIMFLDVESVYHFLQTPIDYEFLVLTKIFSLLRHCFLSGTGLMLEPFLSSKTSLHQQNEKIIVLWIHFTRFLFCMLAIGAVTVLCVEYTQKECLKRVFIVEA